MKGPWAGDHRQSAGWRYSSGNPHFAIDVAMPGGTPLYAIGDGRVIDARTGVTGNGYGTPGAPSNWVILEFRAPSGPYKGRTLVAYYQHLKNASVKRGERVRKGQLIGRSNNTGNSSGDHLHLVVLKPGHTMTEATRYAYLNHPDWVVWPIADAWGKASYGPLDVHLSKLRPDVVNSASVRFLRKCLINRGLLIPKKGLSVDKPGNDYTKPVGRAVALWQERHGYTADGTLNWKQAQEFFAKNTKIKLHR